MDDHIAPHRCRREFLFFEFSAELVEHLEREKCDLALVIILIIKETVSADAVTCHAFDRGHFNCREIVRFPAVMTEKIVAGRDVKMPDFHCHDDTIRGEGCELAMDTKQGGIESEKIIRRRGEARLEYEADDLTIEEPLEIRIESRTIATTMRTPGQDEELAAGFLISEGIITSADQLKGISRPDHARNSQNIIRVELADGVKVRNLAPQRLGTITSSCGICGRESIDAVRQMLSPISSNEVRIAQEVLLALTERMRERQGEFARTGGIHAAAIFDSGGDLKIVREDIGRHNAVDKVIGRAALDGLLPLDQHILLVSGRASFEIVQKALAAGIPIIASVSAPSSLAVSFCRESNQTLIGFLRPPSFNIYSHVERVVLE